VVSVALFAQVIDVSVVLTPALTRTSLRPVDVQETRAWTLAAMVFVILMMVTGRYRTLSTLMIG
jgi:hypothetical protein